MLNEKVTKLLNEQINKEFYSAYLYLDMANFYANKGLDGFANWFNVQALEEQSHAMLFTKYLQNNGFAVTLEAIAKPHLVYKEVREPLVGALEHEQYVTASIHNIYDVALSVKDFRTMEFLNWFVKEQGEEEMNAENLILAFDSFGKQSGSLFAINKELKERKFHEPSLNLD
ncbi:MAG: ferritin [Bacilli bacterium]